MFCGARILPSALVDRQPNVRPNHAMHTMIISVGHCLWITSLYLAGAQLLDGAATVLLPWIYLLHKALAIVFVIGCVLRSAISGKLAGAAALMGLGLTLTLPAQWQLLANLLIGGTVILYLGADKATARRARVLTLPAVLVTLALVGHLYILLPQGLSSDANSPFLPALISTPGMAYLSVDALSRDSECRDCHPKTHDQWRTSAHRFSSFNNPAYRFTVLETRSKLRQRNGHSTAARLCAGCHDPVALLTGAFDDENFDLPHEQSELGVTCLTCHGTSAVTTTRGNASLKIEPPPDYPFARAESQTLRWLHDKTLRSTPAFHKASMLKPVHHTPAFCGACHKAHLPQALNDYRWLRGQNHYDSFLQSGISGHSARSFYYPDQAASGCASCHMKNKGAPTHRFPGANTALPALVPERIPASVAKVHEDQLKNAVTVDIISIRPRGAIAFDLPLATVAIEAGREYVAEIVLANRRVGHHFTQGTADSNQVWLDVALGSDDQIFSQSGGQDEARRVDRSAHFVNSYQLDRKGQRIDRRNAEDIHAPLYDHQIPPGSADVVRFAFQLPAALPLKPDQRLQLTARLKYRKFDTHYVELITGGANTLPITEISSDQVIFGEADSQSAETWRRLNDYGIALLGKPGGRAQARAIAVFEQVAQLNPAHGLLNLARAKFVAGDLSGARKALDLARPLSAHPWTVTWLEGELAFAQGNLDDAIQAYTRVAGTEFETARERGFDFAGDYEVRNRLGSAYFLRGIQQGESEDFRHAISHYRAVLSMDSENPAAHFGIAQVFYALNRPTQAEHHRQLHETYRVDEQAIARVGAFARQDPLIDQAADPLNLYRLH